MDASGRQAVLAGRWQAVFHSSDLRNQGCKIFRQPLNVGPISIPFTANITFSHFLRRDIVILKVKKPACSSILLVVSSV